LAELRDRFFCLTSRARDREVVDFLRKYTYAFILKKRSPYVWRNYFVFVLDGPTISGHTRIFGSIAIVFWGEVGPTEIEEALQGIKQLSGSAVKVSRHAAHVCKML
jgi:hypothetical protein